MSGKEIGCCDTTDEDIDFVLYQFEFLNEPAVGAGYRGTSVTSAGILAGIAVGDGDDIKIVRLVEEFVRNLVPLRAETFSAGIMKRFSGIMHSTGRCLADLHDFCMGTAKYNRVWLMTEFCLAMPAGANFIVQILKFFRA